MKRAEAEKLLGGYATGTLTEAERRALFEAALADQELFNAVADEEALRELLADASVRRRLVAALAEREVGLRERLLGWWQRPWAWGVAGSVAVAAVLVVMLLPVYQTAKRPAVQEVAQKVEPSVVRVPPPLAPPPAAAVPRRQRAAASAQSAVETLAAAAPPAAPPARTAPAGRLEPERQRETAEPTLAPRTAERTEERQAVAEAVRTAPAPPPAAERAREQAEVKPKPEAAPAGLPGGVVGGIVAAAPPAASVEADARTLYNAPSAEWKDVSRPGFRAQRAADVAAARTAAVGMRYAIQKLGAEGRYAEVAPGAVFAKGDMIRLSVEANQSGIIRLVRQDARGAFTTVAEMAVQARLPQVIPSEGLRLELSGKLTLELTAAKGLPAQAGKPRLKKAADERAVYVVETGGASQVRAEIELIVR